MRISKFEEAIPGIIEAVKNEKTVLAVFLYGSVARGDYSIRHSDLDLFIILEQKNSRAIDLLKKKLIETGVKKQVNIHPEFQTIRIREEDKTLFKKIFEEGRLIYSRGFMFFDAHSFGLMPYRIIKYSTKGIKPSIKSKLTQILHGRMIGKNRKSGIIDGDNVIGLGKGALMSKITNSKYIENMFKNLNIKYEVDRIVYI